MASSSGGAGAGTAPGVGGILRGTAWALDAHLRRIAPSVRPVAAEAARERFRRLQDELAGRPVLLFYWIEDALPLMLGALLAEDLVHSEIAIIRDETVGGRITAEVLRRTGRPVRRLRTGPPGARARDVGELLRAPGWLGIAVDGRGPYRRVGSAFARFALHRDGLAVPLAARIDRAWTVRAGASLRVPRRGTALAVGVGDPIVCLPEERAGAASLQGRLQEALDEAGAFAERALREGAVRAAAAGSG